jgi:hypothetical protein
MNKFIIVLSLLLSTSIIRAQDDTALKDVGVSVESRWRPSGIFEKGLKGSVLKLILQMGEKGCKNLDFIVTLYEGPVAIEKSPVVSACLKGKRKKRFKFLFEKVSLPAEGFEWRIEEVRAKDGCRKNDKKTS